MKIIIWVLAASLLVPALSGICGESGVAYAQAKNPQRHAQTTNNKRVRGAQQKARPSTNRGAASRPQARSPRRANAPQQNAADARFEQVKRSYRLGEISDRQMWEALDRVSQHSERLSHSRQLDLLQLQANMLLAAGYPILASLYAADAVQLAEDPYRRELARSWEILWAVTQRRPLQSIMENLAATIDGGGETGPPAFGRNWYYFVGNSFAARGEPQKALASYGKLRLPDRYFLAGRYQTAILQVEANNAEAAEVAFQSVLHPQSIAMSPLSRTEIDEVRDYSNLALGRLYYQESDFRRSITHFRNVRRDSPLFYDALFEQSWAFFMGGFPNHALGSLHAVESPFFIKVFNPEAPVLRSIINYWMCRYEDSRNALADFAEVHSESVEALKNFLDRQQLREETAYQLFEDLISGVTSRSLGMPASILNSAAEKDAMLLLREQFASVHEELGRIQGQGVYRSRHGTRAPARRLQAFDQRLRREIGGQFIAELRTMKRQFESLYDQAQFLYVELLMSETEQILGRELHASSKISDVSLRRRVQGWGNQTVSWESDDKQEYWWDEVGFYIHSAEPQCNKN